MKRLPECPQLPNMALWFLQPSAPAPLGQMGTPGPDGYSLSYKVPKGLLCTTVPAAATTVTSLLHPKLQNCPPKHHPFLVQAPRWVYPAGKPMSPSLLAVTLAHQLAGQQVKVELGRQQQGAAHQQQQQQQNPTRTATPVPSCTLFNPEHPDRSLGLVRRRRFQVGMGAAARQGRQRTECSSFTAISPSELQA